MSIYETQIFRSSLLDDPKIYSDIEIASSLSTTINPAGWTNIPPVIVFAAWLNCCGLN